MPRAIVPVYTVARLRYGRFPSRPSHIFRNTRRFRLIAIGSETIMGSREIIMPSIVIEQFNTFWDQTLASDPSPIIASGIILLTWLLAKAAGKMSRRLAGQTELRESLRHLLQKTVKLFIWLVGLMIAAVVVFPDFTPASLIAGLGIGTVAVGFAFKDIFENLFAGIMIMLREKMQLGDVIEVEGILGTVEYISLRETYIRQFSGELTIMPNATLFQSPVQIWTDAPKRRFEVVIGVS